MNVHTYDNRSSFAKFKWKLFHLLVVELLTVNIIRSLMQLREFMQRMYIAHTNYVDEKAQKSKMYRLKPFDLQHFWFKCEMWIEIFGQTPKSF